MKSVVLECHQTKFRHEEIARICELFVSGCTHKEISIILGCAQSHVGRLIEKHYFGYKGENKILIKLESKI